MDINTNSTIPSNLSDTFSSKASQRMQEKGIEVIQKTLQNSKIDDETKSDLVEAQMKAFGVTQEMLDKANSEQKTTQLKETQTTNTNNVIEENLSKMQQQGVEIIKKTLDSKLDDDSKTQLVQAQMKAFNVTEEMMTSQATQSSSEQKQVTTTIEPTKQQKNGIDAFTNDLNSNLDDATKKELLKKDIELYGLSQDMINKAIEKFADGNQEKYVQAKTLLGSNMGFNLTA